MAQFTDTVVLRAGATPLTFDGNGTFRFNASAKRVTGLSLSQSLSVYTTDEGAAMALKLSENQGLPSKVPVFIMGWVIASGPTTNKAPELVEQDFLPLDIPIAGNSTMRIDLTTIAGAVQTGTWDCQLVIHYDEGDTPADILFAAAGAAGIVPLKGGSFGTVTALTTTTETALVGNGSTLNIPEEAREIVGIVVIQVPDTAYTASEELGGKVRLEFSGISDAAKQEYAGNGGVPGLGTEVEGGAPMRIKRIQMYLPATKNTEIQVSGFITALSAITGGADWAVNILWR